VSRAVTVEGTDYLVETDPESGELLAIALPNSHGFSNCTHNSCQTSCVTNLTDRVASMVDPDGVGTQPLDKIPVAIALKKKPNKEKMVPTEVTGTTLSATIEDHPNLHLGSQYDKSLRDIILLWVSAKSQTGPSSGLSSKAASYLSIAARVSDVNERQLGLRYLLQELILIPSDSAEEDPGDHSSGTYSYPDLEHFRYWCSTYRPQSTFKYGHAALWTIVDGSAGGVVGRAWLDSYGSSTYGHSVQEANWGWRVHTHEFGHNLGSNHTDGGMMNAYLSSDENFYANVSGTTYTGAMEIYSYMGSPTRAYVYGDAALRHPEEIPFAKDDSVSIASDVPEQIDVLANDLTQVLNGVTNNIQLIEVGQVYPKAAGVARVLNGQVEFDPEDGYSGQAWFSYTIQGDVGNSGNGWLHSADVLMTIGGDTTPVSADPALALQDDFVDSDFSSAVWFNPLLNDEAKGHLWSGDVHVVLGPNDSTAESYSEKAFRLVSANVLSGTGTLTLETRDMNRNGSPSQDYTGYLIYQPGAGDLDQVTIEYTVMDNNGNTATAQAILAREPSVSVVPDIVNVTEDSGDVICLTFERLGGVDLGSDEFVSFAVSGTATPDGLRADYALAGHEDFNPVSSIGSMKIPAGSRTAMMYVAILDDGISEPVENLTIQITGSSSLQPSSTSDSSTLYISDSAVLYYESFDAFSINSESWSGWTNLKNKRSNGKGGDDWFDWVIDSGATPTSGTGPSGDYTSGNGNFFLAEATGNNDKYTLLDSPSINVAGSSGAELTFWYNMYGSGMGTLSIDIYVDGSLVQQNAWSRSGQQSNSGSDWKQAVIDLGSYLPASSLRLRFRADIGSSDLSDIAIDELTIVVSQQAYEGDGVYLSVIPTGYPAPSIQWKKNGNPIPGATGASFFIDSLDANGEGTYEASISNTVGSLGSDPAHVTLPGGELVSAYESWLSDNGLTGDAGLQTADPDMDGISNLLEFAFGGNGLTCGDNAKLPVISSMEDGGNRYLHITYRRRVGGSGSTGISYSVDGITYSGETNTCLDANTWVCGVDTVEQVGTAVDNGDGTETVTVRRSTPVNSGCAFIRLSVVNN
jgi:hypothetical protein